MIHLSFPPLSPPKSLAELVYSATTRMSSVSPGVPPLPDRKG
jgi:hypothetical protein